jgi:exosortase family protein XrtG
MLLVMVITQPIGWTALQIGVESSGVLEMSVFASLVLFYPGWSWQRRATISLAGVAATWVANVVRMVVITYMLHAMGKEALVLAHMYVGKALFFALTIGIYWYLITRPTLRGLNEGLVARRRS